MRVYSFIILVVFLFNNINAQDSGQEETRNTFKLSYNIGMGASHTDKKVLFNATTSIDFDFNISKKCYLQFAPKYTYLLKWNEHYLSLPLHFGLNINSKLSLVVGPVLSYDLTYFRDVGVSAGFYYHFSGRSAISVSGYSFTLYDYHINYLYIPIAVSYNILIFK